MIGAVLSMIDRSAAYVVKADANQRLPVSIKSLLLALAEMEVCHVTDERVVVFFY